MRTIRVFRHPALNLEAPRDAIEEDLRFVAAHLIRTYRCHEAERAVLAYRDAASRPEVAWKYTVHALERVGIRVGRDYQPELDATLRRLAVCLHPDLAALKS